MWILKKIFIILFSIVIATGWRWIELLEKQRILPVNHIIYILGGITFIFIIQQIYLVIPQSIHKGLVIRRNKIVSNILAQLLREYYRKISKLTCSRIKPTVRINIMLPTIKTRIPIGKKLKIFYSACPDGVVYNSDERELSWIMGQGICGRAWSSAQIAHFDSEDEYLNSAIKNLSKKQRKVIGHVKSALSLPMWEDNKIVGILNIDSQKNIEESFFKHNHIIDLITRESEKIGCLCNFGDIRV